MRFTAGIFACLMLASPAAAVDPDPAGQDSTTVGTGIAIEKTDSRPLSRT